MKKYLVLWLLWILPNTAVAENKIAIFAGGCFWCMEEAFEEKVDGVLTVESGYTGGNQKNPSYYDVVGGSTGHYEAVRIVYDDEKVTFEQLLHAFWRNIDPTDDGGQFCDRGSSYRSAIFYVDDEQKKQAEESHEKLSQTLTVTTPILVADVFYPAEEYHQDYYLTNPVRYKYYKYTCGRPKRLEKLWGKTEKRGIS